MNRDLPQNVVAPRWPYIALSASFGLVSVFFLLALFSRKTSDWSFYGTLGTTLLGLLIFVSSLLLKAWRPPVLSFRPDGFQIRAGLRERFFPWKQVHKLDRMITRGGGTVPVVEWRAGPGRPLKRTFLNYPFPISSAATLAQLLQAFEDARDLTPPAI
jgi:hypothetical protein